MNKPSWWWVLWGGSILSLVYALFLFTEDLPADMPQAVVRDIRIVAGAAVIAAMVIAVLIQSATVSLGARRTILGMVALTAVVSTFGMVSRAVVPWAAIPVVVLVIGTVMMFSALRKDEPGKPGNAGKGVSAKRT